MQFPGDLKSAAASVQAAPRRIGYADGTLSAGDIAALTELFPKLTFEALGPAWLEPGARNLDVVILGASGASAQDIDKAVQFLREKRAGLHVLIALRDADVTSSRLLTRAGAA